MRTASISQFQLFQPRGEVAFTLKDLDVFHVLGGLTGCRVQDGEPAQLGSEFACTADAGLDDHPGRGCMQGTRVLVLALAKVDEARQA